MRVEVDVALAKLDGHEFPKAMRIDGELWKIPLLIGEEGDVWLMGWAMPFPVDCGDLE